MTLIRPSRLLGGIILLTTICFQSLVVGNKGEVGVLDVSQDNANQWHSITTNYSYDNPVVILGPPTDADEKPVTVRVRNVGSKGFQFQLDRWEYLPGSHGKEKISYLVIEAGSHTLVNGARIEAGIRRDVRSGDFRIQPLATRFDNSPAVFAQLMTYYDSRPATVQVDTVANDKFSMRLLVEEDKKGSGHSGEEVAWVAIEPSNMLGYAQYVSGISEQEIGSDPAQINFDQGGFSPDSPFFSQQRKYNDDDPAAMRIKALNPSSAIVYQQEEKSKDSETFHVSSFLSFAVFNRAGNIPFNPNPPQARDDVVTISTRGTINLDVLENDVDTEGDIDLATLKIDSLPTRGSVTVDSVNGRITYTHIVPPADTDQFTYSVKDSRGKVSNSATVTINFDSARRLPNTTLALPQTRSLGAYKLVDAVPGLTFSQPVNMAVPPGETNRLFVLEKRGIIKVITNLQSPTPSSQVFLDLSAKVSDLAERGLVGLAFHPNYANNNTFFVFYADNVEPSPNPYPGKPTRHVNLSKFKVSPSDPNRADESSETILIRQVDRDPGHQAGDLEFGPDGYLYCSLGDEGSQTDAYNNTQTITKNFFSGIIRIDVDKLPGNPEPSPHPSIRTDGEGLAYYSIPVDNPWVGESNYEGVSFKPGTAVRTEFYATGLRNPWQISFDPLNGDLYAADVGTSTREEVNRIVKGGNYQWPYKEGIVAGPKSNQTPSGFSGIPPLHDYSRIGSPAAIIGGIVYRGDKVPSLYGRYIFADYQLNKMWSLHEDEGGTVTVNLLTYKNGITAFHADPENGDILLTDFEGKIWRLVVDTASAPNMPANLTQTGAFANLTNLTPNPGIYPYEQNVRFWSDHAKKQRWFSIPNHEGSMAWNRDKPWIFPDGMVWIKHFELEMQRGNPESKRRVETRFLVKTADGSYGLSYQWNEDETEAYLAPSDGTEIQFDIDDGGIQKIQTWKIPGRAECLQCHTPIAGHALAFNTRQLNKTGNLLGELGNQLTVLQNAGYFHNEVDALHTLPVFAAANDTSQSLDARARAYLAVNCASCHQTNGTGLGTWDARPEFPLGETGLLNGVASNDGGNPENRLIVPGSIENSILLSRLKNDSGFERMPPLATTEIDEEAIQLISEWITSLASYEGYQHWRLERFGSDTSDEGDKNFDADFDSLSNYQEYLINSNPLNSELNWKFEYQIKEDSAWFEYDQLPNRSFQIEISKDLKTWSAWNAPDNVLEYPQDDLKTVRIEGSVNREADSKLFFRWKIREP